MDHYERSGGRPFHSYVRYYIASIATNTKDWWNVAFELKYRIQQFHVFTSAPYFHFQILEPKNEEERSGAIKYFKENQKTYISFVDEPTILLYIGCTETAYIRSSINNDYDIEQLKSAMTDVSRWYQVFGKKNRDGDKEP